MTPSYTYLFRNGTASGQSPVYLGRDGLYDWINTIQGARAYDSDLGGWTTPDAYAGDIADPMSQKSYMWNRNNAVSFADQSGYWAMFGNPTGAGCSTLFCSSDDTQVSTRNQRIENGALFVRKIH